MQPSAIKKAVLDLMKDYERANVQSVTCDTISNALRIKKSFVLKALHELLLEGSVEYARKNPTSSQSRFQIAEGALRK